MLKSLEEIRKSLVEHDHTLAVAESVTAGNLQAACSLAEEATYFFQGGITAYNLGQKARHLHIDPIAAENCNCVSPVIAGQMALRSTAIFSADWGIGVTGYAAPVPEWDVDTTLFAYYALVHKQSIVHSARLETPKMEMKKVQDFYVREILRGFADFLKKYYPTQQTQ